MKSLLFFLVGLFTIFCNLTQNTNFGSQVVSISCEGGVPHYRREGVCSQNVEVS